MGLRERYIGRYNSVYNGIVVEDYCPSIIEKEKYYQVQELLNKNNSYLHLEYNTGFLICQ